MNAKKAKLLRGIARGKTVGMPMVSYKTLCNCNGKSLRVVLSNCTRALYQQLKKAA